MDYVTLVPSSLSAEQSNATYSCSLTNTWSAETHPVLYSTVESTAHWSSPVLAAHSKNYDLWVPDTMASLGIELLAEMGATGQLRQEITAAQNDGIAGEFKIGIDQFNAFNTPQIFEDILLTPEFSVLSTATMMAPSSDWFTGIPGFSPIDRIDRVWYESFEVATYPWDAGTEKGDTYDLNNIAEDPHRQIIQLTVDTLPENGILLNPSNTTVLPVALWSCFLQHEGKTGSCLRFGKCDEASDCCSGKCERGRCDVRDRVRRKDKFRLSNQGDVVGGAAGRKDPREGDIGSMMVEGETLLDEIDEAWLRGSGGTNP